MQGHREGRASHARRKRGASPTLPHSGSLLREGGKHGGGGRGGSGRPLDAQEREGDRAFCSGQQRVLAGGPAWSPGTQGYAPGRTQLGKHPHPPSALTSHPPRALRKGDSYKGAERAGSSPARLAPWRRQRSLSSFVEGETEAPRGQATSHQAHGPTALTIRCLASLTVRPSATGSLSLARTAPWSGRAWLDCPPEPVPHCPAPRGCLGRWGEPSLGYDGQHRPAAALPKDPQLMSP